jgi:hypothetical protein
MYIHYYNNEVCQKKINGLTPMEYRAQAIKIFRYFMCPLDREQFNLSFHVTEDDVNNANKLVKAAPLYGSEAEASLEL